MSRRGVERQTKPRLFTLESVKRRCSRGEKPKSSRTEVRARKDVKVIQEGNVRYYGEKDGGAKGDESLGPAVTALLFFCVLVPFVAGV